MEDQNRSLIKVNSSLLAALSKGTLSINVMPKDILVLESLVAGTSFRNLKDVEKSLNKSVRLELKREPDNKYDDFAVALYFKKNKVGFLPRDKNETIARLIDAGKSFFATITAKEWEGNWLKIEIQVYLKD